SPLVIGVDKEGVYCASDIPAFLPLTNRAVVLENGECAIIREDGFEIRRLEDWEVVERKPQVFPWSPEMAEKTGYPHFMLKEIHEQPQSLRDSLRVQEMYLDLMATFMDRAKTIYLVACGTSYHACLAASYLFSEVAKVQANSVIASEFIQRYGDAVDIETLVLAVSQSGETLDTLTAVMDARNNAATILGLTNVIGSTLTRVSRVYLCQQSGPEIGVAATKTYTSQLAVLTQLAIKLGLKRGNIAQRRAEELLRTLRAVPEKVEDVLERRERRIREIAIKYKDKTCFLFLGRGVSTATAAEGNLKLLEITYIPSITYPAGESKHGPISLIYKGFPVVFICPRDETYRAVIGNIMEMKARGASIIAIIEEGDEEIKRLADDYVEVPKVGDPLFAPILYVVPLQLFAYYMSIEKGLNPDQPRSLAKSVTVH
ncbi:MAG: glutamine--fructose-6-phosphate transaminase (isomerizing), partial [Candidatus Bathyarchaeia archaeon]